jgi:molybdenum cofactor cytidylyltransferase
VSIAGLILAAGESRRMGFPKALLPYRAETFLDTLIGMFAERCSSVIVVLGAEAERIREQTARPANFAVNQAYLLLTLVDHPAVMPATIDALLATPRPRVRVPRYGAKRGHPIWFSRDLIPEFLAIPEGRAANEVVHRHRAETHFLDLDDPGILADIDDPEAYRNLTRARA